MKGYRLIVHPGSDLVARFPHALLLMRAPEPQRELAERLVALCSEQTSAPDSDRMMRRVARLLAAAERDDTPTLALAVPAGDRWAVLLHGDVVLTVRGAGELRLSGADSAIWVDRIIDGAFDAMEARLGEAAAPPASPDWDLQAGVVPGAGWTFAVRTDEPPDSTTSTPSRPATASAFVGPSSAPSPAAGASGAAVVRGPAAGGGSSGSATPAAKPASPMPSASMPARSASSSSAVAASAQLSPGPVQPGESGPAAPTPAMPAQPGPPGLAPAKPMPSAPEPAKAVPAKAVPAKAVPAAPAKPMPVAPEPTQAMPAEPDFTEEMPPAPEPAKSMAAAPSAPARPIATPISSPQPPAAAPGVPANAPRPPGDQGSAPRPPGDHANAPRPPGDPGHAPRPPGDQGAAAPRIPAQAAGGRHAAATPNAEPPPPSSKAPGDPATETFESVLLVESTAEQRSALPTAMFESPAGETGTPQVRGILCSVGHFNDPDAIFCRIDGGPLGAYAKDVVTRPRPPLGVIVFDDGSSYTVDGDYVLGREPERDPQVADGVVRGLIVVDGEDSISRIHAEIRVDGWTPTIVDRKSVNGTYVAPPGSHTWDPLEPERPMPLIPGTWVQIGGRTFVFDSHVTT